MFWRRKLPHWVPDESIVFVTWRLAGTLPQPEPRLLVGDPNPGKTFMLQDRQLDWCEIGPHWLGDRQIAGVVAEALLYGERVHKKYELYAWVILNPHS